MKDTPRSFGRLWPNSSQHGRHGIYTVPLLHAFSEETDAINDPIARARSKIDLPRLAQYFIDHADQVFTLSDLEFLLAENSDQWNLPPSMTPKAFLRMLLKKTKLRELRLHSPHYSSLLRYTAQGNVSPISVALSIMKNDAYFSHASAMWIHGLGKDHRNVFVNKEQSQKDTSSTPLSQEAIHRAFRNKQRRSKLFYKYEENTITVLSGKHTGRNGVVSATAPSGHKVDVTSIERTLIDITVRPGYAGDVHAVLEAFRLAKDRISVSKLTALLRRLDYTYPYHQSIGFYLKRAGYPESDQLLAKREPIEFDFYLSHNLKAPDFDPEWRVFFPRSSK
jgi:hypothetical protein